MSYQEAARSKSTNRRYLQLLVGINEVRLRIKSTDFASQLLTPSPEASLGNKQKVLQGSLAPHHLLRATELLQANLNGPMGVIEIANACKLTRSHFSRAFKLSTGVSPAEWRLKARMVKAKELLTTSLSLAEVGLESGFCDQSHFTKAFTRLMGMTPKTWRIQMT